MRARLARWLRGFARWLAPVLPPSGPETASALADDLSVRPPRFVVTSARGGAAATLYAGESGATARDVYLTTEALAKHYGDRAVTLTDGGQPRDWWPRRVPLS